MYVFPKLHKLKHFSRPVQKFINYLCVCQELSEGEVLEIITRILLVLQIEIQLCTISEEGIQAPAALAFSTFTPSY